MGGVRFHFLCELRFVDSPRVKKSMTLGSLELLARSLGDPSAMMSLASASR